MIGVRPESVGNCRATSGKTAVDREKEFQRVLMDFGPALARFSRGYELDPEHRRDLLQEMYIAVWRSLDIFDSRCSLRTWVYRVAHNTAVKDVMRGKRRAFASLKSLEEIDEPEDPKNVEDEIHREIALQHLSILILGLKPLDRQVILLYIEDVGADEIAEITGLARGTRSRNSSIDSRGASTRWDCHTAFADSMDLSSDILRSCEQPLQQLLDSVDSHAHRSSTRRGAALAPFSSISLAVRLPSCASGSPQWPRASFSASLCWSCWPAFSTACMNRGGTD